MATQVVKCPRCGLLLLDRASACPRCGDDRKERYRIVDSVGYGVTGVVYRAHDRELDEMIALKVLHSDKQGSRDAIEQLRREVKLARRISHPHIARMYDLVSWRRHRAVSQEFIEGIGLDAVVKMSRLPLDKVVRYVNAISSAIDAAHSLAIVHRDLKPANIRIDRADRPRIVDFGVAGRRGRHGGNLVGTPLYMAPEQAARPESVDARSDIYSLGVILFEMVTGRVPFPGRGIGAVLEAHSSLEPPLPSELIPELPKRLDDVILRCLAKAPEQRYQSARQLHRDLLRTLRAEGVELTTPGTRRGTALVVDDDPETRLLMEASLAKLGVSTVGASDGQEGIELAAKLQPDLILLDLIMPVLNGTDTLRLLKADARTRQIPVVVVTSVTEEHEAVSAKHLGAELFINKPARLDVLELVMDRFLESSSFDVTNQPTS